MSTPSTPAYDALCQRHQRIHHVIAPPIVLPAVATRIAGQNSSGFACTSSSTTGSDPIGSSVAEMSATTNTAPNPTCGRDRVSSIR